MKVHKGELPTTTTLTHQVTFSREDVEQILLRRAIKELRERALIDPEEGNFSVSDNANVVFRYSPIGNDPEDPELDTDQAAEVAVSVVRHFKRVDKPEPRKARLKKGNKR